MMLGMALALALTPQPLMAESSSDRMLATIKHLSSYPTRNTNSPYCDQAAEWIASEFRKVPGLQVEIMRYPVLKGRRIVADREVSQVIATLKGKTDRTIVIGGHFDTINLSGDPLNAISPGANDDASGVAVTMEAARLLAGESLECTIKFVAFSGEEQGLFGSTALAERAYREGWKLEAMLNNDTVGGGRAANGQKDLRSIRLYSEDVPQHQGRELARAIEFICRNSVKGFAPQLVFRRDRFQRGGDHSPFNKLGYSAVRFIESFEDLSRQHTERDTLEGINKAYLSNALMVNVAALRSLGNARAAPTDVAYDPKQDYSTTLRWKAQPGVEYVVYWRESSSPVWQKSKLVGAVNTAKIDKVNKDTHIFAVGAVGGIPVSAG